MSKSYDNTLPCFLGAKPLRKAVMRIQTDSTPPEAPKDPDSSLVYQIHKAVLTADEAATLAGRYRAGISWGEAKQALAEDLEARLAEPRDRYERLVADPKTLDDVLRDGAKRVRAIAAPVLERVRTAMGVRRSLV
jgi:tryptophanyl-tRNA synthetase